MIFIANTSQHNYVSDLIWNNNNIVPFLVHRESVVSACVANKDFRCFAAHATQCPESLTKHQKLEPFLFSVPIKMVQMDR